MCRGKIVYEGTFLVPHYKDVFIGIISFPNNLNIVYTWNTRNRWRTWEPNFITVIWGDYRWCEHFKFVLPSLSSNFTFDLKCWNVVKWSLIELYGTKCLRLNWIHMAWVNNFIFISSQHFTRRVEYWCPIIFIL